MTWSFEIKSAYNNYLRNIVDNLISEDFYFYSEGADEDVNLRYYFSSIHLNHLTDENMVIEDGFWLKSLFDGLSYLLYEDKSEYVPLKLGPLVNNNTNKTTLVNQSFPEFPFGIDFTKNIVNLHKGANGLSSFIYLLNTEPFIRNILLILSDGMNYRDLYQALDEIKYYLSEKSTELEVFGFSKAQIKRFTNTANNFKTLGKHARHGRNNNPAPKDPMKLSDAQTMISQIIKSIVKKFYGIDLPQINSYKVDSDFIYTDDF